MGFFEKLKSGLAKTRAALITPIEKLFSSADKVDDDFYDELLDLLIMADVGVETSDYIVDTLRADLKAKNIWLASEAKEEFRRICLRCPALHCMRQGQGTDSRHSAPGSVQ